LALEIEAGVLDEDVVVAVVVKDPGASFVGTGGDRDVGRGKTVVADRRELALGLEGPLFDVRRNLDTRQLGEIGDQSVYVTRGDSRIPGLQ
jgi:hypothetical protein